MTTWITDLPDSTARFLPGAVDWLPIASPLAAAFNPGKPSWSITNDSDLGVRTVILIDEAQASQFDVALEYANRTPGLPDKLICLALTGVRFRGQRQRPWVALRGNLHLTAHYNVDVPAADAQAGITMIPAIAAAEAIGSLTGHSMKTEIKWVNDIWLQGRKVAGVLSATRVTAQRITSIVFGIGINVDQTPAIEPTPFVPEAGCLKDFYPNLAGSLPKLFKQVMNVLDESVALLQEGQSHKLYQRYQAHAGFIGQPVRIWPEGTVDWSTQAPQFSGVVLSMNSDLSLNLDSTSQPVRSGRLAYEDSYRRLRTKVAT
jgi:biotin-[acetyl-CoA-carboxylase] ligase BirA-like protein